MSIGVSLAVIALGAILTWAVSAEVAGVDIHTVGVILLVVGLAGLLVSLVLTFAHESWAAPTEPDGRKRR
jgi:uncharacterized YccA/Bax inhibitor family protein